MDKLDGLIKAYRNRFMEKSLTTNLSNISFSPDINHEEDINDINSINKIYFEGISAVASVNNYTKIYRHNNHWINSDSSWLPIYPLKNNFAKCLFLSNIPNQFVFKFITPKNTSVSDTDFIQALTSCVRQTIPNFGTVLSIAEFELPYAVINEIHITVKIKDNKIDIYINGNFFQLGKILSLKFVESENARITLSIIQSLFKKSIEINLEQSLWRIGLDSLKIAMLEFKLKAIFDGAETFSHGYCMKLQNIRQLLEIVNPLKLKETILNTISKCDLNLERLPITEAQKQLLFLCKTENGNDFVEEFSAIFDVPIKIEKMKEALSQTLEANPSLKSIFGIDYANLLPLEKALNIFTEMDSFENYTFDVFSKSSLIFFFDGNKFSMKFHHILLDGKSLQLFVDQLMEYYNGSSKNPTKNPNYFDFAVFEKKFLVSSDFSKDIEYWNSKLSINHQKLPKDINIDSKNDYSGEIFAINFPASLTKKLQTFCSSNSVSLFSAFIAFYRCFIYKLYGFSDFKILISIDNRLDENFQKTIGLFINLATVSFELNPCESFETLLKQATTNLTETISHATVPFNKVISALRKITLNEPEIPEVMLVHDCEAAFAGVQISSASKKKFVQNSQIWYLKEIGETLKLQIEFRNVSFSSVVIKNQAERFLILMEKVLQNPKLTIKSFDFLTEKENVQFLDFRQSLSNPLPIISPIELIFQKLEANPNKIILKILNEQFTAKVVIQKIIQYAGKLKAIYKNRFKKQLPKCDQPIALLLQRSVDLIILVLASWYLNLAPLMVTPDWPFDRIQTNLKGFQNLLLITDDEDFAVKHGNSFDASISVISVKSFQDFKQKPIKFHLSMPSSNPTNLAYLTFTSGSTGTPKAVESIQRGLINIWQNYSHHFSITSKSTVYQVVNPAFDIFFSDILSAFGNGGTLFLASQKIPKMDELRYCSHAYIMPAYLSQLDLDNPEILKTLQNLEAILYGGEAINPNFLEKALKAGLKLFQQFGVTEHSIYSNFISPKIVSDRLIIGANFDNFHGYLIDSDGCRIPPINLGIQGWFRSAGIAVARGYARKNDNKKVFGEETWFDGWKYFDSGDRMKIIFALENENPWNCKFYFCGRSDTQIKIRGNRVELRDIEESFRQHSNIKEIVCLFDGSKLLAFITFKENSVKTSEKDLREFAQEKLPIYMIPEIFKILETFPLNSNGKIDHQKLLSISTETSDSQNASINKVYANSSIQNLSIICCKIFAKHLKTLFLSAEDDLFKNGADSLKLLMAAQEIEDTVGIKLDLSIIFRVRTVSKTLELFYQNENKVNILQKSNDLNYDNTKYEEKIHQLSYSQEHLWFLEKLKQDSFNVADSDAYILKFKITLLKEELSERKWNDLIKFLVTKHPILRTQIIENDGIPSQKILKVSNELVQQLQTTNDTISINVLNEPPVKLKVYENLQIMEIFCHHIAIDGYSLNILINDIEAFFKNLQPSEIFPDYSYFDFIKEQKSYDFSNNLNFFQQKLEKVKEFSSPTDFPRSQCSTFKAGHYRTTFEIHGFDDFLSNFQISETHFILAIFAIHQFTNFLPSKILNLSIGLPFANRTKTNFLSTVGYFVNPHAIPISRPSATDSFQDFLTQIKNTVLEFLSHSSTPFELIVRQLKPKREKNKSPIFQQMIIFEDLRNSKIYDNFKVIEIDSNEAKLDQTWRIKRIKNDKFEIHVEFIQDLFKKETIEKSVESLKILTTKALESKIIQISDFFETFKAPKTLIENLWKEILEVNKIESYSNFFEEGGHSLLAARLTSMINAKLRIKASLNLLFEHQTLAEYIDAIERLIAAKNENQHFPINENYSIQTTVKFSVNPLQIPMLELLRKGSDAGNSSILEAYVNTIQIQCPKGIKLEKIKTMLEPVLERHTVLRSKFGYTKIDGSTDFEYFQEIQSLDYCRSLLFRPTSNTMNIFQDLVFRASIDESDILKLEISHLVSDGHSMNILAKDLFLLFTNKYLPDLNVNYQTFNQIFIDCEKEQRKENTEFWSNLFHHRNYSKLETDFIEKDFNYSSSSVFKTFINANSTLAKRVKMYQCSPLTLLLYSFAFRFREKLQDFSAPLKIAFCKDMRPSEDFYNCIGFFVNTLIIPIEIADTIRDIEEKVKNAQIYSWITVDGLRKLITKDENESIFDVMLVVDNSPTKISEEKLNGFQVFEKNQNATKFDLTIFVQINGKDLNVKAEFRKNLWNQKTIENLLNSWESDGFDEKLPKISNILLELHFSSEKMITVDFDQRDITVILCDVFKKYNGNVAFKTEDSEISYSELQIELIQISENIKLEYFKTTGCLFGPDTIVPVISKNSIEQWLICLGIIFAGGAYLPIDANTPEERILKILTQLQPTLIVSDKHILDIKSLTLDKLRISVTCQTSKFTSPANPQNLAYVIFTSGTTGIPKGVCINRMGLSNLISDAQNFFSIDSISVIYQFTNFCFDNSVLEVFGALGSGATCFISDGFFMADKFCKQISDYGITHAMLFPGLVETFDESELADLKKLQYLICGAEKLGKNLFKKAMDFGINVIQNYGPTETTAYCLRKKLGPKDDPQNLGAPIQNAIVTVRRPDGWEAMEGSKAELFIASVALTRGYLGRKWKDQPFVTFGDGIIYYPSGDMCQRLESGEIRFVGRKDNQIKIRGFRIELDEIESCLLQYPTINAAKVILNQKMEDIIAFYSSKIQIETQKIKEFLKQKLPYYMIPRFFIYLEAFPLTSNSKIDTKKLLKYGSNPKVSDANNTFMEQKIKQIWQKILKLDSSDFDLEDSFFYLGGNSLTAQKLITEIKNALKFEIKMEEFYRNPTMSSILSMTQMPQMPQRKAISTAHTLIADKKIPLSFQQEQMLYLEQIDPESSYNLAFIQEFDKTLDIQKMKIAFYKLLEENPEFRTIFKESEDNLELYQQILPMNKCFIEVNVEPFDNTEAEKSELKQFKQKKFDLFKEIPIRVKILETTNCYIILLIIHHAFSDATTTMLMEKEISRIYRGRKRIENPIRLSYQEYSIQQKSKDFKETIETLTMQYLGDYGNIYKLLPAKFESIFKTDGFIQQCKSFKFKLFLSKSNFTPFTLITSAIAKTFLPIFPEGTFLLLGFPIANRTTETAETFGNFLNNLLLPLISKHLTESLDDLQIRLLELSKKYGQIPFQQICKSLRKNIHLSSTDIQIYLNCRYDLENESELDFDEIKPNNKENLTFNGIFEEVTNYPIEIDLDEIESSPKTFDKNYEITVRISKTFFEADEKMLKQICKNLIIEAEKLFHGKTKNSKINEKMLHIFNKFLQADLCEADLQKSFIDLGGDSILAMKLRRAVLKETGIEVDLKDIMTSKSLMEILNSKASSKNEGIIEFYKNENNYGALIVFFYPIVGGCLVYSSLIKELKERKSKIQCIVGFHPPSPLPKNMEELASIHKSQLMKAYDLTKFSKIILIGASFGAALGYHFCQNLSPSILQSTTLISIDGTLKTSQKFLPSFYEHKKQIINVISKFSSVTEADDFNVVENEIESSWNLLKIAAIFTPKPFSFPIKCILMYTSGSENLKDMWKKNIQETTVIKIKGSHETMLSSENSTEIAEIIFSNI